MIVICIVYKPTIFHGKNAEHAGILGLSASQNSALNTLVPILDQIGRAYEDGTRLKGSSQLDGRTLLTNR